MKRFGLFIILVLSCGVVFGVDAGEYRVEVIGGGALTFAQPRCVRVGPSGRVYLLEGRQEWVSTRILGPDLSPVRSFGQNERTSSRTGRWYHPASLRPTKSGDVLVADTGNRRVLLFSADGKFKKVAVASGNGANVLEGPTDALELPDGGVVVCDSASNRVLLYDDSGKLKRVIASKGTKPDQVNGPFSLALDRQGELWIVDTVNRRLVERGPDFAVKRIVKPTTAEGPLLRWPSYLDFDREGNLLVADDGSSCVLKLSPEGKLLRRIGMTPGELRPFSRVSGVAVCADGTLLASDAGRNLLFRFDAEGTYLGRIGWPVHGERQARPVAFGVGADGGFFWVMSKPLSSGQICAPDGSLRAWFGGEGTQPGKLLRPRDAALGPDGHIYVVDSQLHNVTVFKPDGILVRVFGKVGKGSSDMHYPRAIAVSDDGLVYVGDAGNRRVQLYNSTGEFVRTFARRINPYRIDVDADGNCAVYDDADGAVIVFDRRGAERWRVSVANVRDLHGMAFAPDGRLWLLDGESGLIRMFSTDGKSSEVSRDARFSRALGLVCGRDGKMYVNFGAIGVLGRDGTIGALVLPKAAAPFGQTISPSSLALVWEDELAVLSRGAVIQIFGRDGTFRRTLTTTPPIVAGSLAAGPDDKLYVLDLFAGRLYGVSRDGRAQALSSGRRLRRGRSFAVAPDGKIYLSSRRRRGIVQLDAKGNELGVIRSGSGERQFRWPRSFCVTPAGDVLIVDWYQGNVFCYGPDLKFKWMLDQTKLDEAQWGRGGAEAIRADRQGNIFLLSGDHNCIRKFSRARKFVADITLDEAEHGRLSRPMDLCVDDAGIVYVADTGNNRVLKFIPKR